MRHPPERDAIVAAHRQHGREGAGARAVTRIVIVQIAGAVKAGIAACGPSTGGEPAGAFGFHHDALARLAAAPLQHGVLCAQDHAQPGQIHRLNGSAFVHCLTSRRRRCLARHHKDRLHARRRERRVRRAQREGRREVGAFRGLRRERAQWNPPRCWRRDEEAAFIARQPARDDAAAGVRIHRVARQRHRLRRDDGAAPVLFREHISATHPTRLAHIDLRRPAARGRELIRRQAPRRDFIP